MPYVTSWHYCGDENRDRPMWCDSILFTDAELCLNIKTVFPRYWDSHVKDKMVFTDTVLRLNIKTVFPKYGDSHVKDKMVVRPSYL